MKKVDPQLLKMALTPYPKLKAALFPQCTAPSILPSDITLYHLIQVLYLGSWLLDVSARSLPGKQKALPPFNTQDKNYGKEGWSYKPTSRRITWEPAILLLFHRDLQTLSGLFRSCVRSIFCPCLRSICFLHYIYVHTLHVHSIFNPV